MRSLYMLTRIYIYIYACNACMYTYIYIISQLTIGICGICDTNDQDMDPMGDIGQGTRVGAMTWKRSRPMELVDDGATCEGPMAAGPAHGKDKT